MRKTQFIDAINVIVEKVAPRAKPDYIEQFVNTLKCCDTLKKQNDDVAEKTS